MNKSNKRFKIKTPFQSFPSTLTPSSGASAPATVYGALHLIGTPKVQKLDILVKDGKLAIIPNYAQIEKENKEIEAPALEKLKNTLKEMAVLNTMRQKGITPGSQAAMLELESDIDIPVSADIAREYICQQQREQQAEFSAQRDNILNDFIRKAQKKTENDPGAIQNYLSQHENTVFQLYYAAEIEYSSSGRKTRFPTCLNVYIASTPEGESYHIDKTGELSKEEFIKTLQETDTGVKLAQELFAFAEKDKLESAIEPTKNQGALLAIHKI